MNVYDSSNKILNYEFAALTNSILVYNELEVIKMIYNPI